MIPHTTRTFTESRDEQRRRTESYTDKILALVVEEPGQICADYARATLTPPATCQMILCRAQAAGRVRSVKTGSRREWFPEVTS